MNPRTRAAGAAHARTLRPKSAAVGCLVLLLAVLAPSAHGLDDVCAPPVDPKDGPTCLDPDTLCPGGVSASAGVVTACGTTVDPDPDEPCDGSVKNCLPQPPDPCDGTLKTCVPCLPDAASCVPEPSCQPDLDALGDCLPDPCLPAPPGHGSAPPPAPPSPPPSTEPTMGITGMAEWYLQASYWLSAACVAPHWHDLPPVLVGAALGAVGTGISFAPASGSDAAATCWLDDSPLVDQWIFDFDAVLLLDGVAQYRGDMGPVFSAHMRQDYGPWSKTLHEHGTFPAILGGEAACHDGAMLTYELARTSLQHDAFGYLNGLGAEPAAADLHYIQAGAAYVLDIVSVGTACIRYGELGPDLAPFAWTFDYEGLVYEIPGLARVRMLGHGQSLGVAPEPC